MLRRTSSRLVPSFVLALLAACGSPEAPKTPAPPATPTATAAPTAAATATQPTAPKPEELFAKECDAQLDAARAQRTKLVESKEPRTVATTLDAWNTLGMTLNRVDGRASLYSEVHPDAPFRAAAEECVKRISSFTTDLGLDKDLYKALAAIDLKDADADAKRLVEHTLRDFRHAGVDKDDATRKRLRELNDAMTAAGLDFDRHIREDVRKVQLDPAQLKGMPADYVKAHPVGEGGKVTITTDYPDYLPFWDYGEDPAARKELYLAFQNRGWPQNDESLKKLLTLRKELATTLGYASFADYVTYDKMIKSGKNAQDFIDKITKVTAARAKHDYSELLKRKKKDVPAATEVAEWEKALYAQKLKREDYAFDGQTVRPYFDFTQTQNGLLALTAKMYGLEYKAVPDAPRWHADVDVYDVNRDGKKIGRIYLDLHPRDGKYKHAANFGILRGVKGVQLPESALICNFPDPKKGEALMDHEEVVTFFHEFGHLMHNILAGEQRWVDFSGISTEHDFVEAPSQMFEEWAWDPGVLATFAKHKDTKQPIPADVVKKMRRARDVGKGTQARQQMFYAELSLRLHMEPEPAKLDTTQVLKEVQARYGMFPYVEGTHFQANFGHLNGYSAMYYTYMWSLVIAKDLLTEFKKKGLMDPATDAKYRDQILAKGGTKDAAELVKGFLGREYEFKAYEAWLNAD
jgi:thimet oligopeptidase